MLILHFLLNGGLKCLLDQHSVKVAVALRKLPLIQHPRPVSTGRTPFRASVRSRAHLRTSRHGENVLRSLGGEESTLKQCGGSGSHRLLHESRLGLISQPYFEICLAQGDCQDRRRFERPKNSGARFPSP